MKGWLRNFTQKLARDTVTEKKKFDQLIADQTNMEIVKRCELMEIQSAREITRGLTFDSYFI
jgi:hypothetical protein